MFVLDPVCGLLKAYRGLFFPILNRRHSQRLHYFLKTGDSPVLESLAHKKRRSINKALIPGDRNIIEACIEKRRPDKIKHCCLLSQVVTCTGVVLTEREETERGSQPSVMAKRRDTLQKNTHTHTGTCWNVRLGRRRGQRRDCAIPAHLVNLSHLVHFPSVR